MTYEELEEVINNIFAAQGRSVSAKILSVWVKEIMSKPFYDEAIKKAEEELMADEEERLTLPKLMAVISKYNAELRGASKKRIDCDYCKGLNYVYTNIFFEKTGKFRSLNYAIKCFHNDNNDDCAKMVLNEETHNKTMCQNGYMLVFKDMQERDEYMKMVDRNDGYDLWVNPNEVIGEEE